MADFSNHFTHMRYCLRCWKIDSFTRLASYFLINGSSDHTKSIQHEEHPQNHSWGLEASILANFRIIYSVMTNLELQFVPEPEKWYKWFEQHPSRILLGRAGGTLYRKHWRRGHKNQRWQHKLVIQNCCWRLCCHLRPLRLCVLFSVHLKCGIVISNVDECRWSCMWRAFDLVNLKLWFN